MALCELDEVKRYLSIDGSAEEEGDLLEELIDNVSKMFETECDREFSSTEHTEYFSGGGRRWIRPKHYPITAITSLWDDNDWGWNNDDLVDTDEYKISNDERFVILKNTTFVNAVENVKVTYTAGYSTIPLDLKMVCIDEVARLYKARTQRHLTSYSNTEGENLVFDPKAFSDTTKTVLKRYLNK